MSAEIKLAERDRGAGRGETRARLQVCVRGAGAGPLRGVLRQRVPRLDTVTRASVEAWIAAARRRAVKPATVNSLIAPVRELARWLHRRGVDAYVLPAGVLQKPARYIPHIYSDRELAALFEQTDRCRYCPEVPLRHLVMPVLFRTIYACGLRCSEARLLRVEDVDIDTGCCRSVTRKAARTGNYPSASSCARGSPATTPSSPDSQAGSGSSPAPRWACR